MITEIAYTGTPVTDMKRARAFYENLLGLKPTRVSPDANWVEYDVGPATFGIGCYGDAWKPSADGTCITFEVDNLDSEISRLKSQGVVVAHEPIVSPVCRFAIICDPDGNRLMLHQRSAPAHK
jgi:predicted enzyme related to lactoylglutathione lyase